MFAIDAAPASMTAARGHDGDDNDDDGEDEDDDDDEGGVPSRSAGGGGVAAAAAEEASTGGNDDLATAAEATKGNGRGGEEDGAGGEDGESGGAGVVVDDGGESKKRRRKRNRKKKSGAGGGEDGGGGGGGAASADPSGGASSDAERRGAGPASSLERTVFVEGLPFASTPEQVRRFFKVHGISDVVEMRLPTWQDSGRLCGFGHVAFASEESKARALGDDVNGKELGGRYVSVSEANAPRAGTTAGAAALGGGRRGINRGGAGPCSFATSRTTRPRTTS